jgi:hypothetical protein
VQQRFISIEAQTNKAQHQRPENNRGCIADGFLVLRSIGIPDDNGPARLRQRAATGWAEHNHFLAHGAGMGIAVICLISRSHALTKALYNVAKASLSSVLRAAVFITQQQSHLLRIRS